MNYEEKIAKLEAARAAVEAAKVACETAGVDRSTWGAAHDVFGVLTSRIDATRASADRRKPPVAIGDAVRVIQTSRGTITTSVIVSAGPKWIHLRTGKFSRESGTGGVYSYPHIDFDDLARINRDLPAKRGAR